MSMNEIFCCSESRWIAAIMRGAALPERRSGRGWAHPAKIEIDPRRPASAARSMVRIRLSFDERIDVRVRRSWYELPSGLLHISDLCVDVGSRFGLEAASARIILKLEGFALPADQPIAVLRDGDLVVVKCKGKRSASLEPAGNGADQKKRRASDAAHTAVAGSTLPLVGVPASSAPAPASAPGVSREARREMRRAREAAAHAEIEASRTAAAPPSASAKDDDDNDDDDAEAEAEAEAKAEAEAGFWAEQGVGPRASAGTAAVAGALEGEARRVAAARVEAEQRAKRQQHEAAAARRAEVEEAAAQRKLEQEQAQRLQAVQEAAERGAREAARRAEEQKAERDRQVAAAVQSRVQAALGEGGLSGGSPLAAVLSPARIAAAGR